MITSDRTSQENLSSNLDLLSSNLNRKNLISSFFLLKKIKKISSVWKIWIWKQLGIEIDYSCKISNHVVINLGIAQSKKGRVAIASKTQLSQGVILDCWGGQITLEENVFLGPYTIIYGHGGVTIGRDSLIAMHCRIIAANHTIPDCDTPIRSQPDLPLPINIGKDVWLGAGVTILGGVTIGDGCVVGAGAVVTKDLPPYSVAVGVPAQVIKQRSKTQK